MATKKILLPKPRTGYGYFGVWWDGTIGWFAPQHISGGGRRVAHAPNERVAEFVDPDGGDRFFLCKVVITPVKDKKRRPVTRIVRRKEK